MKRISALFLLCVPLLGETEIKFNRDILPVLSDKCFFCHGPDKANQAADLRLDIRESAIEMKAIVPGDPDASLAIQRILTTNTEDIMPPLDSHLSLTDHEKSLFVQWIKEGAIYEKHWSFIPVDIEASLVEPREVPNQPMQPIDQVVFAGLDAQGLSPQAEAEKTFLLRRVTFDLIGLPPTPAEVQAFLADDSPGAFERVVDELLTRPEYGERMAVHWLDLSRYADSYGYQVDRDRKVWAWKDWVIDSFNANLPYDDFVTYQLAGDLLPNPTHEQRLATTFNRLHQQKAEGGSVEEEFRVEYIADRVNTFGTAFLGLTLECARCHDHKYDPISQKNYFELFAFFDDIDESGLYSYFGNPVPTPTLSLANAQMQGALSQLSEETAAVVQELMEARGQVETAAVETWYAAEPNLSVNLESAEVFTKLKSKKDSDPRGLEFDGDAIVGSEIGKVTRHDPFTLSFWMWASEHRERAVICHLSNAWTDGASRGWELLSMEGKLRFSLIHFWPGNAISIEATHALKEQEWTHVTLSYDGSSQAEGMRLYLNGELAEFDILKNQLTKNITNAGEKENRQVKGVRWGARARDFGFKGGRVDDAKFFAKELHPFEVHANFAAEAMASLQAKAFAELDSEQLDFVEQLYAATELPSVQAQTEALIAARKAQGAVMDEVPTIMTMVELPEPKKAYILHRGAYDARGDEVFAGTPESLTGFPADTPANRLGLAKWLVDPEHPLFARVAVNRFWMLCFGRGLVDTAEDFGLQGEHPLYPELLDYLAADFIQSGWDVKALMRQLVLSQTYRQQSVADHALMTDDPSNRLLARGPSHRLPAEMIRDGALAASGLLKSKDGGSSVRPYDLSEAFTQVTVPMNDGLYRRSVYTYWKLRAPSPVMMAFDAVKRDVCSAKRQTTNTPLQSLVLLNGPQFVEAARVAAVTAWEEEQGDLPEVIRNLSLRFISREPSATEIEILSALFDEQQTYYTSDIEAASALLSVGERESTIQSNEAQLAAVTVLAQALMNFDESVMKR